MRHGGDTLGALLFFFAAAILFPFAIGPSPEILAKIAPGIIWVCALLAALLPLDRLFGADFEDGSLDQLLLSGLPATLVALGKAASHWLILRLPGAAVPALLGGLALGTALLSLIGTACAAIVLGARRGGVLLPVLVLPLTVPVVIFGAAAADAAGSGLPARAQLLLLGALLAACLPLCPVAAGAALRQAAE